MSRLSNMVERPFTKTLQWKNEKFDKKLKKVTQERGWYYYVKSEVEGEKGTNVAVDMPFTFLYLLSATSFSGYNEENNASIYSNEVLSERDLKELFPRGVDENVEEYTKKIKNAQILTAKMGKDTIATGFYKDIKANVVEKGGKYCQPIYALLLTDEGTEIVRILISGSGVETWIPFANPQKLRTMGVSCCGSVEKTKGSNDYEAPKFQYVEVDEQYQTAADEAAQQVLDYFKFLIGESTAETKEELATAGVEVNEDLPWNDKN